MELADLMTHADELYAQGRLVEALGAYEAVLADHPTVARAYSRIGAIHAQTGATDLAEVALSRALDLDPALAAAHSNLGNLHYTRGEYEQALVKYKRAVELEPGDPLFHENLHAAYKKLGRFHEAVAALKQANRLNREKARREANTAYTERRPATQRKSGCLTVMIIFTLPVIFTSLYLTRLGI